MTSFGGFNFGSVRQHGRAKSVNFPEFRIRGLNPQLCGLHKYVKHLALPTRVTGQNEPGLHCTERVIWSKNGDTGHGSRTKALSFTPASEHLKAATNCQLSPAWAYFVFSAAARSDRIPSYDNAQAAFNPVNLLLKLFRPSVNATMVAEVATLPRAQVLIEVSARRHRLLNLVEQ